MIIDITPIRATLLYRQIATYECYKSQTPTVCCYAVLTFQNWGQVATPWVCPIYQQSSDGLGAAVNTYISLTDLTPDVIMYGTCASIPPTKTCVITPGTYTEQDMLLSVEVYCNKDGQFAKYLGLYDINKPYYERPIVSIIDTYIVDRSLNPGYVNMDPTTSVISRGIFDGITASVRFSDGTVVTNAPVTISVAESSAHEVTVTFDASLPTVPQAYVTDVWYNHPDYGLIGELVNLMLPPSTKLTYQAVVNTQISI